MGIFPGDMSVFGRAFVSTIVFMLVGAVVFGTLFGEAGSIIGLVLGAGVSAWFGFKLGAYTR